MVLAGLAKWAAELRERRGVWFIDNVAALMALVRGRSDSSSLDNLARAIHTAIFALKAWIYFEWVPSESNWSDGISREGEADGAEAVAVLLRRRARRRLEELAAQRGRARAAPGRELLRGDLRTNLAHFWT